MAEVVERFRNNSHPKAQELVRHYEARGHFADNLWNEVRRLDLAFNLQIAMGLPPEDLDLEESE